MEILQHSQQNDHQSVNHEDNHDQLDTSQHSQETNIKEQEDNQSNQSEHVNVLEILHLQPQAQPQHHLEQKGQARN